MYVHVVYYEYAFSVHMHILFEDSTIILYYNDHSVIQVKSLLQSKIPSVAEKNMESGKLY